jgi:hypothetical protein
LEEGDFGVARNLAVFPAHTSGLKVGINPGNFLTKLPLQEISNHGQTGRTGSHDNRSTFLRRIHDC